MTWLPFKQWRTEEAARHGVRPTTIARWIHKGHYPGLRYRRENSRVISVQNRPTADARAQRSGEIHLRDWVTAEAKRERVSRQAIWMRLHRGKFYPPMKIRRVSRIVQFCRLTNAQVGGGCAA